MLNYNRSRVEPFFVCVLRLTFGTSPLTCTVWTMHGFFLYCFKTVWLSEKVVSAKEKQLRDTDEVFLLILPCLSN